MTVPRFVHLHRSAMMLLALWLIYWCATRLKWDWLPLYWHNGLIQAGLRNTVLIFAISWTAGLLLGTLLGLAQAIGPIYAAAPSRVYCTIMRGTPLLLQLWLIYFGLGSLFPQIPWIRNSGAWVYLREGWPFAVLSLSLCFAAYEGEVLRGALRSVPKGQLEAAKAFGMSPSMQLRRVWLPQAFHLALPTLGGDAILLLKSTPLVATVAVKDLFFVSDQVRQDTFIVYEPLIALAVMYVFFAGIVALCFRWLERRVPNRSLGG
ncbi:ABC transporter permease subunit [Phyllobacterium myrsinacearum]|uniref:ABC transporter permease n=1 Tax=Phyllobacterium myrsinacearum TaxID=28101 RepID=A0A2S9JQT2_9HYPH|nr:ABC transporter permease subunit [Phyllobacterium myrsinacearum]PRD55554.1 ABC transporter permease [Phyllobacterium myrsinacearum]PWV91909.1 polar amino acid transport system permease protein [Phyllobacterium myrsinacearum]RZS77253.1 polar amino acid transport system permease protein [Phyllobacterium myrsinacearum]RZV05976.1 polar amino acid transport system permease protein [Phyllobacterium myrsinacearum]